MTESEKRDRRRALRSTIRSAPAGSTFTREDILEAFDAGESPQADRFPVPDVSTPRPGWAGWDFSAGVHCSSAPCAICHGTGETIEFPADDDERLVQCTTCGGEGFAVVISQPREGVQT